MKLINKIAALAFVVLMTGCASGLNSLQQREYAAFENDGVLIEEKNPMTGLVLGLLPGFGSFYAREPALGVVNLLLWPASILWDPISGHNGSKTINYDITKHYLKKEKKQAMAVIEGQFAINELSKDEFFSAKKKIDAKYDYE